MLVALATPTSAGAVERDVDEAITYIPAFVFTTGAPGEQLIESVVVKNSTVVDASFEVAAFDMAHGTGDTTAATYVPIGDAPRGAGAWLHPDVTEFQLAAGTERTIRLRIDVPSGAGAGGHFGALMFTARETTPRGDFQFDLDTPVPVLVTVDGDFQRDLDVRVESDQRWRWRGGSETFTIQLHNRGDVHEVVAGRLRVDGLLSSAKTTPLKPGILLPGERRTQRVRMDLRDAPDAYAATARVAREDAADARATSARLFVLPWWLLVLVLFGGLLFAWRLRTRRSGWTERGFDDDEEPSDDPSSPAG